MVDDQNLNDTDDSNLPLDDDDLPANDEAEPDELGLGSDPTDDDLEVMDSAEEWN